jgi:hypothetical protein
MGQNEGYGGTCVTCSACGDSGKVTDPTNRSRTMYCGICKGLGRVWVKTPERRQPKPWRGKRNS